VTFGSEKEKNLRAGHGDQGREKSRRSVVEGKTFLKSRAGKIDRGRKEGPAKGVERFHTRQTRGLG